ncbi:sensor histidine kinase [Prescottella sp. R16]|uniref:sensor histidine kinase n=1 Tax=Prescottella sp. R16 TaxID=3064529 RepID=UPI00272EA61B|nr:histidine kinase [Prescottella sp. R16]
MEAAPHPNPSGSSLADAVRAGSGELFTLEPMPLPGLSWPRALRWLPHVLLVVLAVLLSMTGADDTAMVLATAHAATIVVALRWPVPAWWISLGFVVVQAVAHPPSYDNQQWMWLVHAIVLALLAFRVRTATALVAAVVSVAVAVVLELLGMQIGSWLVVGAAAMEFACAVALGILAHGWRTDRANLAAQMELNARERAQRTVLEERSAIARELHDVIAHHMSVISIQAQAAPYRVENPPDELVNQFRQIRETALDGLAELRALLGVLRPTPDGAAPTTPQPSLDDIPALVDSMRAAGVTVTLDRRGPLDTLPDGVQLALYRILQESSSNVVRHASGAATRVELVHTGEAVTLCVSNDRPPQPTPTMDLSPTDGHGLIGMRERAVMLGGHLTAGPTQSGRFEVRAELPTRAATS